MPPRLPMASRVRSACKSIGNVDGVSGLVKLAATSTKPAPAPPPPQQQQQQQPERRVAITRCVTPERIFGSRHCPPDLVDSGCPRRAVARARVKIPHHLSLAWAKNPVMTFLQDLPIPALAAFVAAVLFGLIAVCLKLGNDKLRADIQAMRHPTE